MSRVCENVHRLFSNLRLIEFPFNGVNLPKNGVYILYEKNERAHEVNRIVRVGTHTGAGQLQSRLGQHFLSHNKDRSIFRKNIGRAILKRRGDPLLAQWEIDLTTRNAKREYWGKIDGQKIDDVEMEVSRFIRDNFSFVVFQVDDNKARLQWESKLISTISLCEDCRPSFSWLGLHSPKKKIVESGLWVVNELYKQGLTEEEFEELKKHVFEHHR